MLGDKKGVISYLQSNYVEMTQVALATQIANSSPTTYHPSVMFIKNE
jgi:hypothetical protein